MTHRWAPDSPCGPGCLPRPGSVRRAGTHRVALRLAGAAGLMLAGIGVAVVFALLWRSARTALVRSWFRALLRVLGIRFAVRGEHRLDSGALVVTNHVSWLDVVALMAVRPMRLLAKTEVRSWPVIGPLAGRVGTLYIDRERLSALPGAVRTIADSLRGGAVVGAFPEGTTWCGLASGRYRPAVFQAAVDARVPVQPVALRFSAGGRPTTAAAFVGEATLLESVLAVARVRDLVVELSLLPEMDAAAVGDRRELARRTERAVAEVTAPAEPHLPHLPQPAAA
ncbi:MAG: 1-acyl-sn-glycerol-3-phosphate acyltransferase [Saccharopolyspora sp.]|uniref:lysophospholipid acyltransferase family protein n=1 Tax=Saccharopolyspora TaxID=1835 RepID=UPI00190914FC|nr:MULTISPECIES: lysophospholipid acyltransferase family protein [unclassified Saccharopolyspora]MBK0867589.1 1-acyl-sn-glycerol-3-phosphate acyltransferase [Saccharopolyspora sp. HNM0986]MBQ6644770.1 1-acyl-sn-glycerol-3-phosphate acyltransferase [Saccharopolyspora sp.]